MKKQQIMYVQERGGFMKRERVKFLTAILWVMIFIFGISQITQAGVFYKYNIMTGYETAEIFLNKTSVTINVAESIILKATVSGSSDKVSWKSSNGKVASIENGKVAGLKAGTTVITAKINGAKATCTVKVKEVKYSPSQFKDYSKINRLIHYFDMPIQIGIITNSIMDVGKNTSGVDTEFMIACSAWNVDEKYWKEIQGVDGYGEWLIDKKYIEQECKKLFGKVCSVTGLTNFAWVRREGNKVIISGWSSPRKVTSRVTGIVQKSALSYQVRVTYTTKSYYTAEIIKQTKAIFTVKKVQTAPYGYYVSGFRFL